MSVETDAFRDAAPLTHSEAESIQRDRCSGHDHRAPLSESAARETLRTSAGREIRVRGEEDLIEDCIGALFNSRNGG